MEKRELYQQNREKLKELSKMVKPLVGESGEYANVNEALIEAVYKQENEEIEEFNTFNQWLKKGCSVKKGEKAFLVWGQPRKVKQDETEDEFNYWPLCYLFADTQVHKRKGGSHVQN